VFVVAEDIGPPWLDVKFTQDATPENRRQVLQLSTDLISKLI